MKKDYLDGLGYEIGCNINPYYIKPLLDEGLDIKEEKTK